MGYGPSVRSRWLDIGQFLPFLCMLRDENGFKFYKHCKKKRTMSISSHLDQTKMVNKGFDEPASA